MVRSQGECYFRRVAGERFAVRNPATAVVEGVGDHGCEYMTGGIVGGAQHTDGTSLPACPVGIAYVLDEDDTFEQRCTQAMDGTQSRSRTRMTPPSCWRTRAVIWSRTAGSDVSHDMTRFDAIRLRQLVESHLAHTGSANTSGCSDDWENWPKVQEGDAGRPSSRVAEMQSEQERTNRRPEPFADRVGAALRPLTSTATRQQESKKACCTPFSTRQNARRVGSLWGREHMGKPTGFKEIQRVNLSYAPVADRITHYNEFTIALPDVEVSQQGARCMDCGIPFCHQGCPVTI